MLLDAVAPWIIDSWIEVLKASSFELPVVQLTPYQAHLTMTGVGMLLLMLAWRMVGPMPRGARIASLSLLTLALLSPLGLLTIHHLDELNRLPQFAGRFRKPAEPNPEPRSEPPIQTQRMPESVALNPLPPPKPAPAITTPPPEIAAVRQTPATVPSHETAQPPQPASPQPAPPALPTTTEAATATANKVIRKLTKLMPGSGTSTGLIPVFYGTDRSAAASAPQQAYTSQRATRLELGQAIIKLPLDRRTKSSDRAWTLTTPIIETASLPDAPNTTTANRFAIATVKPLERDDFLREVVMRLSGSQRDKDHALIFVPGYNTSFEAGLYRAAQIAYDLRFDGAPFVYSWPSDGASPDYKHDTDAVAKAATYFADFVRVVVSQTGAKSVSFIAHGLGTRLTLDALAALKDKIPAGVTVREVILTAPDIDAALFKSRIASLTGLAKRTTLYVDSTDRALNISRRYSGGIPRAGDVLSSGPLVVPGVDTIDVSIPGTQSLGLNHPDYVDPSSLIGNIAARLRDTPDSPALQSAAVETISTPTGPYHRLR